MKFFLLCLCYTHLALIHSQVSMLCQVPVGPSPLLIHTWLHILIPTEPLKQANHHTWMMLYCHHTSSINSWHKWWSAASPFTPFHVLLESTKFKSCYTSHNGIKYTNLKSTSKRKLHVMCKVDSNTALKPMFPHHQKYSAGKVICP